MEKSKNNTIDPCVNDTVGKESPYQRIVIACPESHIIVVKRFTNGGEITYCNHFYELVNCSHDWITPYFLQTLKLKAGDCWR